MTEATPAPKRSFKLYPILSVALAAVGAVAVAVAGVTPAVAANLASQADTQIAVFMVPLTLLVAFILFEVVRFAWRGPLPAEAAPRPARRPLSSRTSRPS